MTKKSKIALIAAGLIAGATIMGCGGNDGGIPDITGGGGIEQPNPNPTAFKSLDSSLSKISSSFDQNLVSIKLSYDLKNLRDQSLTLRDENSGQFNTYETEIANTYQLSIDSGNVYDTCKWAMGAHDNLADLLSNGNQGISDRLAAYRNIKYLEQREFIKPGYAKDILDGVKDFTDGLTLPQIGDTLDGAKITTNKSEIESLRIALEHQLLIDLESIPNGASFLQQLSNSSQFTGIVDDVLQHPENDLYPALSPLGVSEGRENWDGNIIGVPVPSIVKQNASELGK